MSDSDSFIEEVTEEVRRDQLFGLMKRWGWVAILAVLVLVGGAAYNEYYKAQNAAQAQALGDGILKALEANEEADARAKALGALDETLGTKGDAHALLALIAAGEEAQADQRSQAAARLRALANEGTLRPVYRDLGLLKAAMLDPDLSDEARIEALTPLAQAGAPYWLLAEEQIAIAEANLGKSDEAIARLTRLAKNAEASQGLRSRAEQLIVALGGTLDSE
ncbi:MAG: hypothetical protein ACRBBK_00250 [Paracoccaceae bacterium]